MVRCIQVKRKEAPKMSGKSFITPETAPRIVLLSKPRAITRFAGVDTRLLKDMRSKSELIRPLLPFPSLPLRNEPVRLAGILEQKPRVSLFIKAIILLPFDFLSFMSGSFL